jgi:hypothetical protein
LKVRLHIQNPGRSETVEVKDELTIGRTPAAQLVLDDPGLSRVNTTVFIDGDEVLAADENSTNGTFVNGERISGPPRILRNGDVLTIGSLTTVRVEIEDGATSASPASVKREPDVPAAETRLRQDAVAPPAAGNEREPPYLLIAAAALTFLIIIGGGVAYLLIPEESGPSVGTGSSLIPQRVLDPLGGEDVENDIDDLIASWEIAEEEIDASTINDVTVMSADAEEAELNVPRSTFEDAKRRLAAPARPGKGEAGIRPNGLNVPPELYGDGVIKQKAKLREMTQAGYKQPMDFADLARKRLERELIEMPMAAESYLLDVGGSASEAVFTSFDFGPSDSILPIGPTSPKFDPLKRLADDFSGQRFNLDNPVDRREMRRRLLRMFQPRAKPILQKLANTYHDRFGRPLRVTSLTRSMDYQILLAKGNANAFKVRGAGSLPPHTSGCAFDLARKHMPVEEQNFLMQVLAEMERAGELDALIEYGVNACFHIFIYPDGKAPR